MFRNCNNDVFRHLKKPLALNVNTYDEDMFSFHDIVDSLKGSTQLHPGRYSRLIYGSHTKLYFDISVICNHGWHGPYCDQGRHNFILL